MPLKKELIYIVTLILMSTALFFIPTGFEKELPAHLRQIKVRVLDVDNADVETMGVVRTGDQALKVRILNGEFEGREIKARNTLLGKLELDTVFQKDDIGFASIRIVKGEPLGCIVHEHYRINVELILFGCFFLFVIAVAGLTGLRAVLTFGVTGLFLWRVLLPLFLKEYDPILVALCAVGLLSFVIIFAIAGFNKKGVVAFLGAMGGTALTCILSLTFGEWFKIDGAVRPFTEVLLFTGFPALNITDLFLAGIFIASSGAVMDVGMDISASMNELFEKKVEMRFAERFKSGMAVGKAVIGTMTTTLLLAYTGGYTAMFMNYMARGKTMVDILNTQYVAAELLHTLVGSFGLVTVAPLTALAGAFIYGKKKKDKASAVQKSTT